MPKFENDFIKLVSIEPGILLTIHCYFLPEEPVVERLAEQNQAKRLLVSFQSEGRDYALWAHLLKTTMTIGSNLLSRV